MNYVNQNIANFAMPACNGCGGGGVGGFFAYASSNTHVVIDLIGYVQQGSAAALDCSNQTSSVVVSTGTFGDTETAACPAGFSLTGGGCDWGAGTTGLSKTIDMAGSRNPGKWACSGNNNIGGDRTLQATAYCCRVPGL